jgi:hypothetical protein
MDSISVKWVAAPEWRPLLWNCTLLQKTLQEISYRILAAPWR